jgi:hypothetical protein
MIGWTLMQVGGNKGAPLPQNARWSATPVMVSTMLVSEGEVQASGEDQVGIL